MVGELRLTALKAMIIRDPQVGTGGLSRLFRSLNDAISRAMQRQRNAVARPERLAIRQTVST
jgi:hypothetical protein